MKYASEVRVGDFEAHCRREEARAVELGLCPKIVKVWSGYDYRACGKPLQEGQQWCWRHKRGEP